LASAKCFQQKFPLSLGGCRCREAVNQLKIKFNKHKRWCWMAMEMAMEMSMPMKMALETSEINWPELEQRFEAEVRGISIMLALAKKK